MKQTEDNQQANDRAANRGKDRRLTRSSDDRYIGGVEVIRRVAELDSDPPRFLALSVSDAPEDVVQIVRAGARGYVTKTVEAHVSAVLRKLQLSTRHELSRWAAERDLVDYD